jgi:hypothetical protein
MECQIARNRTPLNSFGHFHRFRKNGDTGLTTLGRVSFVIPPSYISLCVYGL